MHNLLSSPNLDISSGFCLTFVAFAENTILLPFLELHRIIDQESMEHFERQNPPHPSLCQCPINQSSGFDRFLARIRSLSSLNSTLRCQECVKKEMGKSFKKKKNVIFGAEFLWICLDCERIFCGAESVGQPDGHVHYHAITNRHPAAIQIAAWCFECKAIRRITTREVNKDLDSTIEFKGERGMEQGDFDDLLGGYVVKPMQNLGNSCFFNAVLQNLLSMDVLRAEFADLYCQGHSVAQDLWSLFLYTSDFTEGNVVMVGHADLFASICSRVPDFSGHQQQDSHELLRYLLSELVAEGATFVEDIFGGRLSSTISCVQCGNSSKSYEPFLDLSLAIPSKECSTEKDEVATFEDLVLPVIDIYSCPPKCNKIYSSMEAIDFGLWVPESLGLSSQLSTAHAANLGTKFQGFSRKITEPLESQRKDEMVEVEEDTEDCCGQNPCICNEELGGIAESLDGQAQIVDEVEEDPEDCCGQNPCICNEDFGGVADSLESQWKVQIVEEVVEEEDQMVEVEEEEDQMVEVEEEDQMVEVEDDPEDFCGQNPCICNKELGGIAESLDGQAQIVDEVEEEDPEDCCGQNPCICNKDLGGVADSLESPRKVQIFEEAEEDLEDCCGQISWMHNIDLGRVAEVAESRMRELSEGGVVEDPMAEIDNLINKLTEQNDNLDSDGKDLSVKLDVISRKRPRCASTHKFEDEILSGDPLSIEKCFDLFTAPEILSGEYSCDHCSNCSRDRAQTELQGTRTNEKFMEGNQLRGHGVKDEVKTEVWSNNEGLDIGSRKAQMDVSKRYLIFKAPLILTIHLKRFTKDNNGITKKINSHVNIKEILDLTPYVDPSCEDRGNSRYHLMGVVQHLGVNLTVGHYVAYVRGVRSHGSNEIAWFRASDVDVREVSLNEVLNSDAYILFYERM